MKELGRLFSFAGVLLLVWCSAAWAGGEVASEIVVVADTRVLHNPILRYIADTYNTNIWLFAVWSVVLTAVYGAFLGLIMDYLIKHTGLDLSSRKIVEH